LEHLIELVKSLHSAEGLRQIVVTGGLVALIAIIFAETGLLAGFFLPGDSLLVTAGIFAAGDGMGGAPLFNVWTLLAALSAAGIIGDQVGFWLGSRAGKWIYQRPDSLFFKRKHLDSGHAFYEKHGGRALIFARFVPIFRTFVPFAAGMAKMEYRSFVRFNVVGGFLWVFSMVLTGYFLGKTPLANQLHKVILVVIFVSILPILIGVAKKFLAPKRLELPETAEEKI
jgi:membrane-associated protein